MELTETNTAWTITGQGCYLREVRVDLDIHLLLMDEANRDWVRLNIGNDSALSMDGNEYHPSATTPSAVEPLLRQLRMPIAHVVVTKDGRLTVTFNSGAIVRTEPDEQCEAWEINCSLEAIDYKFICAPGGEVAFFQDAERRPLDAHGD